MKRTMARKMARELTDAELKQVSGGWQTGDVTLTYTDCGQVGADGNYYPLADDAYISDYWA